MTHLTYEQPSLNNSLVQVYVGHKALTSESRKILVWKKPRLTKFISFFGCAGGGGGGSGAASTNGVGGGGGGSGTSINMFVPAIQLPDILYISVGHGGLGGNGVAGSTGGYTLVSYSSRPFSNYSDHLIFLNPGTGGNSGGSGGGTGGSGGSTSISYQKGQSFGFRLLYTGTAGTAGVSSGSNNDVNAFLGPYVFDTYGKTCFCGPGAGGGGVTGGVAVKGGDIILGGIFSSMLGSAANSGSTRASDGFNYYVDLSMGIPKNRGNNTPLMFTGGAGGGGHSAGTASPGGHGGYGSGGGGGGTGSTNGGIGGNGGPGLLIITSIL